MSLTHTASVVDGSIVLTISIKKQGFLGGKL